MSEDNPYLEALESLRDNLLKPMHNSIVQAGDRHAEVQLEAGRTHDKLLNENFEKTFRTLACINEVIENQGKFLALQEKSRLEETEKLCIALKSLKWD
jgi:hypothetical protein